MHLRPPAFLAISVGLFIAPGWTAFAEPAPAPPSETPAAANPVGAAPAPAKPDPAADQFWTALRLLRSKKTADLVAGRAALKSSSDLEYTHAQVLLGNCLVAGSYGFSKNPTQGVNLFRLAAERGNAYAMVSLGQALYSGQGGHKDVGKAAEWLKTAVRPGADYSRPTRPVLTESEKGAAAADEAETVAGDVAHDPEAVARATAHYFLGLILAKDKHPTEAQGHFVEAANAGVGGRDGIFQAALQAALNYAFGEGVPRDPEKASAMLEQSRKLTARAGVTLIHNYVALKVVDEFAVADLEEAMDKNMQNLETAFETNIATRFADRKSKDYNVAEAVKWYGVAAESGQAWAMLNLALIYSHGDLGKPDPVKAFEWFEKAGGGDKPKHLQATANLAICYQNGFGVGRDEAKAREIFQKYSRLHIICYLGTLGQAPTTPQTYPEGIQLLENWAKDRKDPVAQLILARRYLGGWDVPPDFKEAARWLKKAMKAKVPEAYGLMGSLHQSAWLTLGDSSSSDGLKAAFSCYQSGSDLGDTGSKLNYAVLLFQGRIGPRDPAKAEALNLQVLEKEPDNAAAHNNLGVIYQDKLRTAVAGGAGRMDDNNRTRMLTQYQEAARLKFALGALNLGNLNYEGILVLPDYHQAYTFFEQAAELGQSSAHFQLGLMHELGQGVPITYSEAAYHFRLAALDGHLEALRHLVHLYLIGQGVSKDLDRAEFWLGRMVQAGDYGAMNSFCDVLLHKGEYEKAVPLLQQMSKSMINFNAGFANERLSECYAKGLGTKADPASAAKYFQKALALGNADALTRQGTQLMAEGKKEEALASYRRAATATSGPANYFLGQMYFFGTNVTADRSLAMRYLRAAAKADDSDALYFLAAMTFKREADAPSLDEAILFSQQAESEGNSKAADLREKLEQRRLEQPADAAR